MGPQMYNPSPNMMGQPNNGYGSPQTSMSITASRPSERSTKPLILK